jgi:HD-GYP domain-containing protein (c-di-GMP phosphodiesterase class II)
VVIDIQLGLDVEPTRAALAEPPADRAADDAQAAPAEPASAHESAGRQLAQELVAARAVQQEALTLARAVFEQACSGSKIDYPAAKKTVADLFDSVSRAPNANLWLLQLRRYDKESYVHAVNACVLALAIGAAEPFDGDMGNMGLAALLHDIGETRLPRHLLRASGELGEPDLRLLHHHPKLGESLSEANPDIPPAVRRLVRQHHERIDGSGYPDGLRSPGIALESQIVALADMYDDMLRGRRQQMLPPVEALRRLFAQSETGAIERSLVERLVRCVGVYPAGSVVELDTGERAIVIAANRDDSMRPMLRIISSRFGDVHGRGPILDLGATRPGPVQRQIVKVLDPVKERIDPMLLFKIDPTASL